MQETKKQVLRTEFSAVLIAYAVVTEDEQGSVQYTVYLQHKNGNPKLVLDSEISATPFDPTIELVREKLEYLENYTRKWSRLPID